MKQLLQFTDSDIKERIKYGILRRADHYKTVFQYHTHGKPTNDRLTVELKRLKGYDKDGKPIYAKPIYLAKNKPNLNTTPGRDWVHAQLYTNSSAGTRGANFLALSNDAGAPSTADTVVAAEITTNGLGRVDASSGVTHTTGTNVSTMVWTFTCATAPQSAQKAGTLTAISGGILWHENTFTAASLQIGDQLVVTWVFTAG